MEIFASKLSASVFVCGGWDGLLPHKCVRRSPHIFSIWEPQVWSLERSHAMLKKKSIYGFTWRRHRHLQSYKHCKDPHKHCTVEFLDIYQWLNSVVRVWQARAVSHCEQFHVHMTYMYLDSTPMYQTVGEVTELLCVFPCSLIGLNNINFLNLHRSKFGNCHLGRLHSPYNNIVI